MQLFVRGQNVHTIDANVSASVAWLKAVAAQREGLLVEDVVLYNAGRPMVEESSLVDVASDLDTIDMCVKILGGKVHGSLARAGKVKGQTPKVCIFYIFMPCFYFRLLLCFKLKY